MYRTSSPGWRVLAMPAALVLAGCSAAASLTSTPSPAPVTPATSAGPSASPPGEVVTADVAYETSNPVMKTGMLDVFAPAKAGSWPVAVMFHGSPYTNSKSGWSTQARMLANLGFVVFVPDWGHASGTPISGAPTYDQLQAILTETSCAVAFAQTHAADYGGDAATTIIFGHSGGASIAAMVAFARPAPTTGCLGGPTLKPIHALVTWDGDWMAIDPVWDAAITADPRLLDGYTPMTFLAAHSDLRVAMLASEDPLPYRRDLSDTATATTFFSLRDPSGSLRAQLDASGALSDGYFDLRELQELFFSVLKAQGNPVSLQILPGSTHDRISPAGLQVLLAAFPAVK
jgi:acetyl esterase/lipase